MIPIAISFLLGILSLNLLSKIPSVIWIVIWMGILLLLIMVLKLKSHALKFLLLLAFSLGFFWIWLHAKIVLDRQLPANLEGKIVEVTGTISSIPDLEKEYVGFDFDVENVVSDPHWQKPGRIRVHWYLPPDLQIGDKWQFNVKLKKPRSYSNPGSFDLERHFFQNKIVTVATVIDSLPCSKILNNAISYPIDRLRVWINNKVKGTLKSQIYSGIISALVVGITSNISKEQWEIFRKTGTAHLVAISGLHIGLLASFIFVLVKFLWRFMPIKLFSVPIPIIASWMALISAFIYSLLAGFSVATQRALIMISFFMLSIVRRRLQSSMHNYFLALMGVLLIDPLSVLSAGFWLSFGAVGILLYGMKGRLKPSGIWWRWGRAQWIMFLGLTPMTLAIFGMSSIVSPLANMIAIPWVSFLVVPISLIGTLTLMINSILGSSLLNLANSLMGLLWPFLEKLSLDPKATWVNASCSTISLTLAMIGILLLLTPRGFPMKYVGAIWLIPLLLTKPPTIAYSNAEITVLDVGQGLSAVIQTQNHTLVFDTGPKLSEQFDTGKQVVLPFLATRKINEIDVLLISHGDNDHVGGANSILQQMNVKNIISSEPNLFATKKVDLCYAGLRWEWDGVLFEILHPASFFTKKRNEHSCVLSVRTAKQSMLLTADIETESERLLLQRTPTKLTASVLLVPHHGSRTSSTLEFIKAVNPQYAIIPAGYLNKYGHPKEDIVKRYKEKGIVVLNTIQNGAITILLNDEEKLNEPQRFRLENKRYWHSMF